MNLYATVTSERATKGQGGNKHVVVDLKVGGAAASRIAAIVSLIYEGKDRNKLILEVEGRRVYEAIIDDKGKRQTGEREEECDFSSEWDSDYCLTHKVTNSPTCKKP